MNILSPLVQGFFEGIELARAIVWTVPKIAVLALVSVVSSFVQHKPLDRESISRSLSH